MRPLEILLLLAEFSVLALMFLRLSLGVCGSRVAPIVAVLIAAIQLVIEGPRWQIAPAYLVRSLFFPIWRSRKFYVLLGGPALVAAMILSMAVPVFRFDKPTGPYEIGALTYHWVDETRSEVFSADPKTRRELMVQFWYPAKQSATLPRVPYVTDADALSAAQSKLHNWPSFLLGHLKYVKTNARMSATVAEDKPRFPVLLFWKV